ncbi:hypothetical protein F4820DRAFT_451073 [Hypoxylon rubiginosum]|uniref:Uncharacterized protein n=1 Tax=Hypoxylon rubiginosum TaxID=110542 RepID=A0ACB9YSM2_9PEZI|nr:hypothetical protein F4820DRAFT_451073 [Hypoxylon rubiginosum]
MSTTAAAVVPLGFATRNTPEWCHTMLTTVAVVAATVTTSMFVSTMLPITIITITAMPQRCYVIALTSAIGGIQGYAILFYISCPYDRNSAAASVHARTPLRGVYQLPREDMSPENALRT